MLRKADAPYLTSVGISLHVLLPNGTTISSIGSCQLVFPNLPQPVSCHIFPDEILNTSLLSIAQLCRMGCIATFSASTVTITYTDLPVLCGLKSPDDNLWTLPFLPLDTAPPPIACAAYALSSDADFVKFTHAALGSPSLTTLAKAVRRGYLKSYPRLTSVMLAAHPPVTIATAQGHLDQHRQGQNSTTVPTTIFPIDDPDEDAVPIDAPK